MLRYLAILIAVLELFVGSGCSNGEETKYRIDLEEPSKLICDLAYTNEVSEVRVYVTGPRRYFEKRLGLAVLFAMDPVYKTTNTNDICGLIESLKLDGGSRDVEVSSSENGYTYQILLMDTNVLRAMHFRVFVSEDAPFRESVTVSPSNGTGGIYNNTKLVPWIKQWAIKGTE